MSDPDHNPTHAPEAEAPEDDGADRATRTGPDDPRWDDPPADIQNGSRLTAPRR